ncbi:MAG TPA: hypothetical protein VLH77_07310, partial [Gammaproteobacteria bacterium]|nr:hypothetical protein [Gammaproteobacteria bacterium]
MKAPTRVVVLYDGIENSVFESQVLEPILSYLRQHTDHHMLLVSFEKKPSHITHKLPQTDRLQVVVYTKSALAFFGIFWFSTRALRALLKKNSDYHL